ncbi:MAG: class I SAM-dependent methyltransferase [Candidatus Limnocylindrales bacterium]
MDLPIAPSDPVLTSALADVFDLEGKVGRAFAALGPVADRDVVLLDADGGRRQAELASMGARVLALDDLDPDRLPAGSADLVIGCWTGLGLGPASEPPTLARLERVLRPEGRLLLVEDYGRDDIRRLVADPTREARQTHASDRRGPMVATGFRMRTLHCYWTFPDIESARHLLEGLFPETGALVASTMTRPRLEHKVAAYHRTRG